MEQHFVIFGTSIPNWVVIPVAYLVWVSGLLFVKAIAFQMLRRIAKRTSSSLDDLLIQSADLPLFLLIITSGGGIIKPLLPQNADLTQYFLIGFKAVTILAIVMFLDRFLQGVLHSYAPKVEILKASSGIAHGIVRAVVFGLGLLILLDSFGVSITPIIASLGLGSLAVALALQPTLENFFAGIQLITDKPIQVGHFVKLESGEEGYIHHIGWRSTWLRQTANYVIIIPNSSLINSRITNYYYPDMELVVLVEVGVHYGSDLEKVERVTIEVAKEVQEQVAGAVKTWQPLIRYNKLDASSINFAVVLRVCELNDQYLLKHEFIKRLHKRYAKEGIVIPYPIQAVNFDQEKHFSKIEPEEFEKYKQR